MDKILIFGVSGNIGGYVAEYFIERCSDKYEIIGIDYQHQETIDSMMPFIQMDINDKASYKNLPQENVYAVIDLVGPMPARMSGYHPEEYVQTNVMGSFNVFQYAIDVHADRILYAKSFCDILKRAEQQLVLHVNDDPYYNLDDHHAVYAVSQNTAKQLLDCLHEYYGIKTFVFRLPHIYLWSRNEMYSVKGVPHKMMHRIMIDNAIEGKTIEVWGDPNRPKDMVYVKDLAQMFYKACFVDREKGFYNVGTGIGVPLIKQIEGIRDVFGGETKSELVFCPEKQNAPQYVMDITEAQVELGYEPQYSYIAMLEDMKKERELDRF